MNSIFLASLAYFLGALVVIVDKYLLKSKRISSPVVYSFYVGLTGLGVFLFAFFGKYFSAFNLQIPDVITFFWSILSGIVFAFGLLALYWAIHESAASRVVPIVFSIIPLVTFAVSKIFGAESLSFVEIFGASLLVFGGLLISFDLPIKIGKKKFFKGFYFSIASGVLQGISLIFLKQAYLEADFFNGFAWSRLGAFVGVCMFFFVPTWKKSIIRSFTHGKKKEKNKQTIFLFVLNKIIGGSSSALVNFAIKLGSVTIVGALVSLQYVFVLVFAIVASGWLPHIFEEKLYFWDWMQKVIAIIIIGIGTYFISL